MMTQSENTGGDSPGTSRRTRVHVDVRGWPAIAHELGCSVRTAQRYARRSTDPLPVLRLAGRLVGARSAQLDGWMARNFVAS